MFTLTTSHTSSVVETHTMCAICMDAPVMPGMLTCPACYNDHLAIEAEHGETCRLCQNTAKVDGEFLCGNCAYTRDSIMSEDDDECPEWHDGFDFWIAEAKRFPLGSSDRAYCLNQAAMSEA